MLKQGQVVAGRYVLQSLIGEGAMGAVWRAEDQTLRRQIAIKFLFVRGTRDPQAMVEQFLREARIAASVQHRNVIQTVDFGTVDQFQPFMVMELLSGESLGERMAREPKLTPEQFIHLISLTLRGLSAVHDAGIVHRDLKPQNVFLQRDAEAVYPKILDFGISRSLEHGGDRPSAIATQEGLIVGTPDYMSPEQARGEVTIDRRADIYSMGVVLYEGLAGRLPFEAEAVGDLLVQIMTKEPPTLRELDPTVPRQLSDMVAQAMAKKREHRFADARALRRALLAAAEAMLPQARRSVPPAPSQTRAGVGATPVLAPPPVPSGRPHGPPGATWGDFEGLHAAAMVDRNLPPVLSVPVPGIGAQVPQQQRVVAQVGEEIAPLSLPPLPGVPAQGPAAPAYPAPSAPRPGAAEAAGAARARKAPPKAKPAIDGATALDPLYAGAETAAPDIDYDRVRFSGAKRPAGMASASLGEHREQRAATRRAAQPKVRYKRKWGQWVLPALALLLGLYVLAEPPLQSAPGPTPAASRTGSRLATAAGGGALHTIRHAAKARRANPGAAPPHLRDVVF